MCRSIARPSAISSTSSISDATAAITKTTADNRSIVSDKKGGPLAALFYFPCTRLGTFFSVNSAFPANSALILFVSFLRPRRLRFSARQLRHQEFHHRPRLGPTAFQPVIRISQRVQSGQQPEFRNLSRILQRQLSLRRIHPQRPCRLPSICYPLQFAGFDELAEHPGNPTDDPHRLFPLAQQPVEKFLRLLRLPRCQHVRQFPNRGRLLRNHQRAHVRAPNHRSEVHTS